MTDETPQIYSPEVDQLLVLCEEVMRATPEGAKRFTEPAPGVLARAKARQHNIVFGRRGSGKSSLLRKMAAEAIDQLIDLRLIHPVKSRVTLKQGGTVLYEAFMLDLSQYSAARKVQNFDIVDLASPDKDEKIRRLSLIYREE